MNIIFTLLYRDGHHGSVIHVKELSGYYISKGHNCTVATLYHTDEIKKDFEESGINIVTPDKVDFSAEYDILFGIHYPVVSYLLSNKIKIKKLVLNSLSSIEAIEIFPSYYPAASMLVTCSCAIRDTINEKYAVPLDKMYVLENLIPDAFANYKRKTNNFTEHPSKIAVVSNHIPDEIFLLKDELKNSEITYYGAQTGNYKRLSPEILSEYDVIISIGKTIQYSLGLGIPAYEYDRFGGNGYIFPSNMDEEAYYNFAGRNTNRKLSAGEISKEIVSLYKDCREQVDALKEKAINRFLMSKNLDDLLKNICDSPDFSYRKIEDCEYAPDIDLNVGQLFFKYVTPLRQTIEHFEKEVDRLKSHAETLENNIDSMKNSTSWKATAWLRKLINIIKQ